MIQVCKNSNAVMVKTSAIQVKLRAHMYGIDTQLPSQDALRYKECRLNCKFITSNNSVTALSNINRLFESTNYTALPRNPVVSAGIGQVVDVRNTDFMLVGLNGCILASPFFYLDRSLSSDSTFAWCQEDAVIIETKGCVLVVGCLADLTGMDLQMSTLKQNSYGPLRTVSLIMGGSHKSTLTLESQGSDLFCQRGTLSDQWSRVSKFDSIREA